jgi:hypothetical protein
MTTAMNAGRTAGALLIVQMTAGYVTNFVLLQPATAPPGFLVNAHFTQLIVGGSTFVALFATLYRFALIPRALAGFAVAAAALQMVTVARPLFGAQVVFPLLAPAGIAFLLAAVWLLVKGLADPDVGAASHAAAADSPARAAGRAPRS